MNYPFPSQTLIFLDRIRYSKNNTNIKDNCKTTKSTTKRENEDVKEAMQKSWNLSMEKLRLPQLCLFLTIFFFCCKNWIY